MCKAKVKRLANHLTQSHPQLSKAQRDRALKEAAVVKEGGPKEARVEKGQLSLKAFTMQSDKPSKPDYSGLIEAQQKTQNFPSFSLDHLEELFQTVDGKERNEAAAQAICVDVSKCLRYHSPNFSWDRLLDTSTTRDYLELCRKAGVGADGLVTKSDRIITALKFAKTKSTDATRRAIIDGAIDTAWKQHWRKRKGEKRVVELAKSVEGDD